MKCNYCGMELNGSETVCPNCGGPVQSQPVQQKQTQLNNMSVVKQCFSNKCQCNKVVYILLAIFFGTLGIHDFYAKYYARGIIKIVLTLIFGVYISLIWSIVDAFKVRQTKDSRMFI